MKRQQFKKIRKRQKWTRISFLFVVAFVSAIAVTLLSLRIYAQVAGAPNLTVQKASIYLDSQNNQIGDHIINERRYWTSIEDMSPLIIDATVAVEDKDFFEHSGFDYSRIAGAIVADIKAGSKAQGASTITQQYARNLYLTHEKTWTRKLNEALYAYRLELFYDKDEILEGYLNTVYYGHGMYGIEAASKYFFAKSAKELTLAEAAMIAGIPKGPTYYSPNANLEKATNRQHVILKLMLNQQKITQEQYDAALNEQLVYKNEDWTASKSIAPYFIDAVREEATRILEKLNLSFSEGGWTIKTTLNQAHQQAAEQAIVKNMPNSDLQVGFVSMNPFTGHVTALVGGRDYTVSPYNRATVTVRQPGSSIKPFLYAAALENGYTPLTFLDVSETTFTYDLGRKEYSPKNVNNKFAEEEISLLQAMAISDNIYAVKTLVDIGYNDYRNMLERFDLKYDKNDIPSTALGTTENTLYDLTAAYNMLASKGQYIPPTTILSIENAEGEIIYEYSEPKKKKVVSEEDAFLLTDMMTGMFDATLSDYSPATGLSIRSKMTHTYAGKSGTTNSDQWMIGYSVALTAGVWNGYDQGKTLSAQTDLAATKRIWVDFMEAALSGTKKQSFEVPDGVEGVLVDIETGKLATDLCEKQRFVYVKSEDVPTEKCLTFNFLESGMWESFLDLIPFQSWFR
jgi:penicillin-binding protein 2D